MELFDLYDRHGTKLNKTIKRGAEIPKGNYHKIVHIWIRNATGQYLIQQRNKLTDTVPFQWAPTTGSVTSGEEPLDTAVRETKEELGIDIKKEEFKHLKMIVVEKPKASYIIELFIVQKEIRLGGLKVDEQEVKAVAWANKDEIKEMVEQERFWNYVRDIPNADYLSILEESR